MSATILKHPRYRAGCDAPMVRTFSQQCDQIEEQIGLAGLEFMFKQELAKRRLKAAFDITVSRMTDCQGESV